MTLKQALWEIVRDENIIITNQNIDWLLDRALKKASGDAQALKESVLERKEKLDKLGEPENKSNEELFKQALVEGVNRRIDKTIEEEKQIEQIEEIAEIFVADCNGGAKCDDCKYRAFEFGECIARDRAEALYNAGYRKQSVGEWKKDRYGNTKSCSICGNTITFMSKYCPECGAKMKGGEQDI